MHVRLILLINSCQVYKVMFCHECVVMFLVFRFFHADDFIVIVRFVFYVMLCIMSYDGAYDFGAYNLIVYYL